MDPSPPAPNRAPAAPADPADPVAGAAPPAAARWPAVGEPAPWFQARTRSNPRYSFDTVAGRVVVLSFFGSAGDAYASALLAAIAERAAAFDDSRACWFGISIDPDDERLGRVADALPGRRIFWDFDRSLCARYGALLPDGRVRRASLVLDPLLRVLAVLPFEDEPARHAEALVALLDRHADDPPRVPAQPQAPVLVLPRVFEPALCEALIAHYARRGGQPSGVMREIGGQTVEVHTRDQKRRSDCEIDDPELLRACRLRLHDRLAPMLQRVFQFGATRVERYIVACYEAEQRGAFGAHRDNTTRGTAHRRFAVSLFLNDDFDGGCLRFPEFGGALYRAPVGGAVVFSCGLLHEALPVTRGRRYMFLPFLYDEEGRRIRDRNLAYVGPAPGAASDPGPGAGG